MRVAFLAIRSALRPMQFRLRVKRMKSKIEFLISLKKLQRTLVITHQEDGFTIS